MMFLTSIGYGDAPNFDALIYRDEAKGIGNRPLQPEPKFSKTITCNFCKEPVSDVYYYCNKHKKTYCYSCARNGDKKVVKFRDAARCTPLAFKDECILQKMFLEE